MNSGTRQLKSSLTSTIIMNKIVERKLNFEFIYYLATVFDCNIKKNKLNFSTSTAKYKTLPYSINLKNYFSIFTIFISLYQITWQSTIFEKKFNCQTDSHHNHLILKPHTSNNFILLLDYYLIFFLLFGTASLSLQVRFGIFIKMCSLII